ncbi:MAG: hypothetical protein VKI83_05075 [Synechococcaceae cyanobacterium]|nr:hypothetical protein [Synechococcaceae cyanobacterium]
MKRILREMDERGQIDGQCLESLLSHRDQRPAIASAYRDPTEPAGSAQA